MRKVLLRSFLFGLFLLIGGLITQPAEACWQCDWCILCFDPKPVCSGTDYWEIGFSECEDRFWSGCRTSGNFCEVIIVY